MAKLMRAIRGYPWVAATLVAIAAGAVLLLAGQPTLATWCVGVWAAVVATVQCWHMVRALLRGHVGLDILAVTAIVATLAVGDVWASIVVVLMLTGGEALETYAENRARRELSALLERTPRTAHLWDASGAARDIPIDDVVIGNELLVKPGELVPVDAELLDDEALCDESSLTGESVPVTHVRGEILMSGSVNGSDAIRVRATARAADSQYQQIVALVAAASDSRAPFVRLADRYAVPFTVLAYVIGGVAWWVSGEPQRFAEVLVVATPCPLLIAAPVAFIGGMSRAARHGVLVKSGGVLEQLARARTAAFDKTGTLTYGRPVLSRVEVFPASPVRDERDLLALTAAAEALSPHVLARAVVTAAGSVTPASSVTETPGKGISALVDGREVLVGKATYIAEQTTEFTPVVLAPGELSVTVAVDGIPAGQLILRDELRDDAGALMRELQSLGVNDTVMLTGDAEATARHVASALGVTDVRAGLLPAEKVAAVQGLPNRPVLMVGDGVNDAPVLAVADIGIAMGAAGATAASESADAVILVDHVSRVATAIRISRRTIRIALQSIWLGIAISIALMLVAAFGVIPAIIGALLQELVDLATIMNSVRAARDERSLSSERRSE